VSDSAIGRLRLHYRSLGSTNDLARVLAGAGYPHGTAVVADHQSAGRGRQGRRWEAPAGAALLCSVLLRPALAASQAPLLSMAAALAAADAIGIVAGVPAALKRPNDILVADATPVDHALTPALCLGEREDGVALTPRKVAGILLETSLAGSAVAIAIAGIGINVGAHPPHLPSATNLARAAGRPIDRDQLLDALLAHLDARLAAVGAGEGTAIFADWRARMVTLGQPVHVAAAADAYDAVAEDVRPDGALLVRTATGQRRHLFAADVTLSAAR
jgi:BirA family biotin operon repressor/biotin-[acetyl-CoA-carboxylase] ligase